MNKPLTVLLYSGGLDSHIASFLYKPDVCLYLNVHGRYNQQELDNMTPPAWGDLEIKDLENLSEWENFGNLILPQRNAFFILQAAYYGERILLGATYGDRSSDKDQYFRQQMELLLNHMWQPQHWLPDGRKMSVEMPMKDFTKVELVKQYLKAGGEIDTLRKVVSCYSGTSNHCGKCKPCARKWVALKLNGIVADFDHDPKKYFTETMIQSMRTGTYRGPKEDAEILKALGV